MRRKKRNTRRRDDQKDAVGGSFSSTRRGLRGGFWFLLSLLFATSAFALVPSSTPTAKKKTRRLPLPRHSLPFSALKSGQTAAFESFTPLRKKKRATRERTLLVRIPQWNSPSKRKKKRRRKRLSWKAPKLSRRNHLLLLFLPSTRWARRRLF